MAEIYRILLTFRKYGIDKNGFCLIKKIHFEKITINKSKAGCVSSLNNNSSTSAESDTCP